MPNTIQPAAEFQALPLEMMLATPLTAVVKAQRASAEATMAFINGFLNTDSQGVKTPAMLEMQLQQQQQQPPPLGANNNGAATSNTVTIRAPMLAMVPVPHMQVDSLTVNFKYEVTQTLVDKNATTLGLDLTASTEQALSPFVQASFKGNLTQASSLENTVNRSGTLDITLRASEAPMPAGLSKLLTILSGSI